MKKLILLGLSLFLVLSFTCTASSKTLKVGLDADPVSLDPQVQLSGGMLQLSHWVFDPLVRWTQELTFEPRLATKWERINEYRVRFYLRKDVKFHSGNPFTAKDVKWSFDRMKKSVDFKGLLEPFVGVGIVDDFTVDVVTTKPYALLLNMATYFFAMDSKFYTGTDKTGQPKDACVKFTHTFANGNESGTGAFVVEKFEQGVVLEMKRFKNYWDTKSPGNVDKFILTPIKEDATRVAALLSGDVDFIAPVPPTNFKGIESNSKVDLVTISGGRIITFQMNQDRVKAFKDARVRQAICYAVNNAGIVKKIMKGTATVAAQQGPAGYVGYKASLKPRFDLKKAKALMKKAGYADGFEITMMAPNNRYVNDAKIAEATAQMLSKIGIKVNLKTMPKAQYWDEFDKRSADMMMIGWHSDTEDSGNFTEFLGMCYNKDTGYGQYNSGAYCNPKVDKLVIDAQSETDLDKRGKMLQKVEQILYDEAAFLPFHWQNHAYGAKKNFKIKPILNAMNFPYFGDLVIE
ncbi:MAG: ABC transporter substrate-binding protein [Desulfobacteraceae bacterium]|nr:ABC transporter substrate-binding protein [Desulfobacteraceae bacterium]